MSNYSHTRCSNDFPEDVLLEVARYTEVPDLRAFLISCRNYHNALAPLLYRTVEVNAPVSGYDDEDADRPIRVLSNLIASIRHLSTPRAARAYTQYIRSVVYISYNPTLDIRGLPMLAMVLGASPFLRHIQLDLPRDSQPLALSLLRRHLIVWPSPADVFALLSTPKVPTPSAPRLESIRSTKATIVAALMERRPITTAVVDHGIPPIPDLQLLLPLYVGPAGTSLMRLSVGMIGEKEQLCSTFHAIAKTFPCLQHFGARCTTRGSERLLEVTVNFLKDNAALLEHLQVVTINHGARAIEHLHKLQEAMDDIVSIGAIRPTFLEVGLGRVVVRRSSKEDEQWLVTGDAGVHRWGWLMRTQPRWP